MDSVKQIDEMLKPRSIFDNHPIMTVEKVDDVLCLSTTA